MLTQILSAKAAVAAGTLAALLAGGAAAATTGSLPVPAQTAVSGALSHVGVSIPDPNSHANPHATHNQHGATPTSDGTDPAGKAKGPHGKGPDATGPAKFGLCTAWAATPTPNAHSHKRGAVAFVNLQKAADAAGMSVTDYCKGVTPTSGQPDTTPPTSGTHGRPSSPGKSGDHRSHGSGSDSDENETGHVPAATHSSGRP